MSGTVVCQVQAVRGARAGGTVCQTWAWDQREVAMVPRFARLVCIDNVRTISNGWLRISPG